MTPGLLLQSHSWCGLVSVWTGGRGRKDPTVQVAEVTVPPLSPHHLPVPGHTGGAPLLPVAAVVAGTPLVQDPAVLEGENTPPDQTEIPIKTR